MLQMKGFIIEQNLKKAEEDCFFVLFSSFPVERQQI